MVVSNKEIFEYRKDLYLRFFSASLLAIILETLYYAEEKRDVWRYSVTTVFVLSIFVPLFVGLYNLRKSPDEIDEKGNLTNEKAHSFHYLMIYSFVLVIAYMLFLVYVDQNKEGYYIASISILAIGLLFTIYKSYKLIISEVSEENQKL